MSKVWLRLALGVGALAFLSGGVWLAWQWRLAANLERARRDYEAGRVLLARERLSWLSNYHASNGEAQYLLGLCEQASGRPESALAAWERVPMGSPFAARSLVLRARWEMRRGHLTLAERLLVDALERSGQHRDDARKSLVLLLRLEGRIPEARRLLEESLIETSDPIAGLKEIWRLDTEAVPIAGVQSFLDGSARDAPGDGRIALGKANLALMQGKLEEAKQRLEICRAHSPSDQAVARAWLAWAQAAQRVEDAQQALAQLSASGFSEAEILTLRAWLAGQKGRRQEEKEAFVRISEQEPGNLTALERLYEIATASNAREEAAALRTRKAAMTSAMQMYGILLSSAEPTAHAGELAHLAAQLGRGADERVWSRLLASPAARSAAATGGSVHVSLHARTQSPIKGMTLADALGDAIAWPSAANKIVEANDAGTRFRFTDEAEPAGLRFQYDNGRSSARQLPETMGGGVALLDYDGDGWLDVYLVQGGHFTPGPEVEAVTTDRDIRGDRLFRNLADGRFADVTRAAGFELKTPAYGHAVAVGDYDNDGHPDLFVTRWQAYALYHNRGDGRFEDVTERAGLGGDRDWPTSAAWADLDGDGDLDLYVCHYLEWDADHPRRCQDSQTHVAYYCTPREFPARPDHLFRNDSGRFVDVTEQAGIVDREGRGLGVLAADLDGDRKVDLFVANDMSANYLFRNLGNMRFEECAQASGVAGNAQGGYQAGMGVACGDVDGDGQLDLVVTNFYGESTTLFRNLGNGLFSDHTAAAGLAAPTRFLLGFGLILADFDNDGWLDMATANGHVNDGRPKLPWEMPAQLLAGSAAGRFRDVSAKAGRVWQVARLGRGLAAGDLDEDGRLDLVLLAQNSPVAYVHNATPGGHFLTIQLEGRACGRDAVGTSVTVHASSRSQVAQRVGGGSYASASSGRLHFGLGTSERVESVEVKWPSGHADFHKDLPADAVYLLREGDPKALALRPKTR